MFQTRSTWLVASAALALCAGACSNDISSPSPDAETIENYVASASLDGNPGTLRTVGVPRPQTGGPVIDVAGHLTIVNGGTATMTVTSQTAFQTVYISGSAPISGLFVPVSGFFELPMPAATTSADIVLAFPQALPGGPIELYFSAADAAGNVGTTREIVFNALVVGTGDVQVTATWNTDADVDLHVVDPTSEEIYWANPQSLSGGELDLDSNAACNADGVRNENITWAAGTAPSGTYTVRVDYWSACQATQTNYTVLVNNGGDVEIHHGTFTGAGDNGGQGSGVLVTTFTRTP